MLRRAAPQGSNCGRRLGWFCKPISTSLESADSIAGWIAHKSDKPARRPARRLEPPVFTTTSPFKTTLFAKATSPAVRQAAFQPSMLLM